MEISHDDMVVEDWLRGLERPPLGRVNDVHEQSGISPVDRLKDILGKAVVLERGKK